MLLLTQIILHCMKSVRIRSYSGHYFPAFGLNKERLRENTDQNNSENEHFLRSVIFFLISMIFKNLI